MNNLSPQPKMTFWALFLLVPFVVAQQCSTTGQFLCMSKNTFKICDQFLTGIIQTLAPGDPRCSSYSAPPAPAAPPSLPPAPAPTASSSAPAFGDAPSASPNAAPDNQFGQFGLDSSPNVVFVAGTAEMGLGWYVSPPRWMKISNIECGNRDGSPGNCAKAQILKISIPPGNPPCTFKGASKGYTATVTPGQPGDGFFTVKPPQSMKSAICTFGAH